MTKIIRTCSKCGKKLHQSVRVKDGKTVTCGICFTKELEGMQNGFGIADICKSNLEDWK